MSRLRRIIYELRLISPTVLLICSLYVVVGCIIFLCFGDLFTKFGGLSANLFAGSIDTLFVVVLINYIVARNSQRQ
jgi:hypothetical protein